jgi:hypothetical protein
MKLAVSFVVAIGILSFASQATADGQGEQISPQMANRVLPYAVLSQDA